MCLCSFLYPCRSLFYHTLLSRHWSQWSKKFYDDIPRNIYEKCNCNPFIVSICRKSNVYNLGIILSKCTELWTPTAIYAAWDGMQLFMQCILAPTSSYQSSRGWPLFECCRRANTIISLLLCCNRGHGLSNNAKQIIAGWENRICKIAEGVTQPVFCRWTKWQEAVSTDGIASWPNRSSKRMTGVGGGSEGWLSEVLQTF